MTSTDHFDVAILGGGLAGLTLAKQLLLQQPELRLIILEQRSFPVDEAAHKVGESTVEIGAHYLADDVGLKKHLIDQQLPKFGLRFFFKECDQSLAEGTEVGGSDFFPAPGYQVDRGRLENHLAGTVQELGATLLAPATVKRVELGAAADDPSAEHSVTFERDGEQESVRSRWMVDTSGRRSLLKRQLALNEDIDHHVHAVWFRIGAELRIDEWCDDREWQARTGKIPRRWLSTNHLLGAGYWVWIIPLASGSTSIGIVADPKLHPLSELNSFEKVMTWLQRNEPLCATTIEPHRDKLQDFAALKKLGYSSRHVFSADRWALAGEAAVFLDPLYSPGIDYIAIGNTMICRLIQQDLAGQPIDQLAPRLESTFLTLFHNNLLTYQDQYPLFGNPRVMSLKYVWDYAIYWGFPALLYFHGKLADPAFIVSLGKGIDETRDMNRQMQEFFRQWHAVDEDSGVESVFVDQNQISVLKQLNAELREPLDESALRERFARNVGLLRELMTEITSRIRKTRPQLTATDTKCASEHRLTGVFEALNI